jgi:hypothetical protein
MIRARYQSSTVEVPVGTRAHPGAASSLREGIAETLTLTRLGISGSLKRTLASTNPCESMVECVRRTSRNVKRWSSGEMALRWTSAGMLEAERQFPPDQRLPRARPALHRDRTRPRSPASDSDPDRGGRDRRQVSVTSTASSGPARGRRVALGW